MRWLRATLLAALLAVSRTSAAGAPDIAVAPSSPRVGDVIFVRVQPERELLRASCSWHGRSYPLIADGEVHSAVLPVRLGTRPGDSHAVLYWKYADGGMGQQAIPIAVKARTFGVQRLRLSRSQERKYSAPETKRERELIGAALDLESPQRRWEGSFLMPAQGRISTAFGLQRYVNGRFDYRHRGVDIACPEGTAVQAAGAGVVSLADESFLLHGKTVVIDHGQGVSSLYIHMSAVEVKQGESVLEGEVIGRVGSTGVATGPHLHFAVYAHHEAVDPLFWMDLPALP